MTLLLSTLCSGRRDESTGTTGTAEGLNVPFLWAWSIAVHCECSLLHLQPHPPTVLECLDQHIQPSAFKNISWAPCGPNSQTFRKCSAWWYMPTPNRSLRQRWPAEQFTPRVIHHLCLPLCKRQDIHKGAGNFLLIYRPLTASGNKGHQLALKAGTNFTCL